MVIHCELEDVGNLEERELERLLSTEEVDVKDQKKITKDELDKFLLKYFKYLMEKYER